MILLSRKIIRPTANKNQAKINTTRLLVNFFSFVGFVPKSGLIHLWPFYIFLRENDGFLKQLLHEKNTGSLR